MDLLRRGLETISVSILLLVTSAASAQDSDALVAQGQRLFEAHGYRCHAIAGTGGKTAPDLSNVGHRYSLGYLTYWLRETPPRGRIEHMPPIEMTEPELQALAAYLHSLRGPGWEKSSGPTRLPRTADRQISSPSR